jgi:hypothetical protein
MGSKCERRLGSAAAAGKVGGSAGGGSSGFDGEEWVMTGIAYWGDVDPTQQVSTLVCLCNLASFASDLVISSLNFSHLHN